MRKLPIATAVAALALALAGVALATSQFKQVSNVFLTAHHAGAVSGIKSTVYSADPGAPGGKPKAGKSLVVTFPSGTQFNFGILKPCTLSVKSLTTPGGPTCPTSTQIGTGTAVANAAPIPGFTTVKANVVAYVRSAHTAILRVTTTKNVAPPTVIQLNASGSKFTIPIPTQKIGAVSVVLVKLTLSIPAKGHLIVAGKCTAGKFAVKSHFKYVDGSTFDTSSSSSCS